MSRSIKKGPYVSPKLLKKILDARNSGSNKPIKTWERGSMVMPEMVGITFAIHDGRKFLPVLITENMVGHRLGEFAPTRNFRGHSRNI
jgi:small subunit ribosomal protein S19|tara:strand:- start:12 stop:275 length:264 start_codon:yes stop_codon:yes gene_type:complete